MTRVASARLGESLGTDFFSVREQFTDEQWSHFITVRRFVDEEVVPVVGAQDGCSDDLRGGSGFWGGFGASQSHVPTVKTAAA